MKLAESLLAGTDALPCNTVEAVTRGDKILVRYRDRNGSTLRQLFTDREAAHVYTWQCVEKMRRQFRAAESTAAQEKHHDRT